MQPILRLLGILGIVLFLSSLFLVWKAHADTATISVTASTVPHASDYSVSLSSNTSGTVNQNTTMTYTITYGAQSSAGVTTPVTLVANFSQDTINGIDVLSYIPSSATTGYNNTTPVVDLINKTITWNISSLPPGTIDQTVSFQLQTNQNYTGANTVNFTITAEMSNQYVILPIQSLSNSYQFKNSSTPTNQPTPLPTATPTVFSTLPVTPSLVLPSFLSVTVTEVTAQTLTLDVQTSPSVTLIAKFGTSPSALNRSVATTTFASDQLIQLTGLTPKTPYFVQLIATDANGQSRSSDIYQFTTASVSQLPQINPQSIVILSNNIPLYVPTGTGLQNPAIVLPTDYPFTFRLQLTQFQTINTVLAILNPTEKDQSRGISTELRETENGIFLGGLRTPPLPGTYEIILRVSDTSGAITQLPFANIVVSQPLTIVDTHNQPIEDAQVILSYKDFHTKSYLPIPSLIFSLPNTLYTDITGQLRFPLPIGAYNASVTAIGYARKSIYFTLGVKPGEVFPTIVLKQEPYNIITVLLYYWTILKDDFQSAQHYLQVIANSHRFLALNAVIATAFLVIVTFLSFIARIRIPLSAIPQYFLHIHKQLFLSDRSNRSLQGIIREVGTEKNLSGATVYLLEGKSQNIIGHSFSDMQGRFFFGRIPEKFFITIMLEGYEPLMIEQVALHTQNTEENIIYLSQQLPHLSIRKALLVTGETIMGMIFETLLIFSFIAEIALGFVLGIDKTIVFLIFSVINVLLWALHLNHTRTQKTLF